MHLLHNPGRRRVPIRLRATLAALCLCVFRQAAAASSADPTDNALPPEVVDAFQHAAAARLYAIEPGDVTEFDTNFHHYQVLGEATLNASETQRVLADLQASLARPNGGPAMCFQPHHRISVHSGKHTYDLVICYLCGGLRIYRDDSLIRGLLLAGTPRLLNELAAQHGVPKPEVLTRAETVHQQIESAAAHWVEVMPASLRPLWPRFTARTGLPDYASLEPALAGQYPDERQRILALFAWYASGVGEWSGYPSYEDVVADLLQRYPYAELSQLAQSDTLTDLQLKGAARFFAGWILGHEASNDRRVLTGGLKDYFSATARWTANMPRSLRPLWTDDLWYSFRVAGAQREGMLAALSREFTERSQAVLALLGWFGSGIGTECSCARYEYVAQELLITFDPADVAAALESRPLTEQQLDGAARFLANWYFQREHPHAIEAFPAQVKAMLLAHIQRRGYAEWEKYSAPFR